MVQFHSSACSWPDFLTSFVEEAVFFPIVYSCLLCCSLIDHIRVSLFLSSLFSSIDLCVCFCVGTVPFWWLQFCSTVWNQGMWHIQLCSAFSRLLWVFGIFCVCIWILGFFALVLWKNFIGILIGIAWNL